MNLSSLSSQLNMSIPELRQKAFAAGIRISPRANKIDNYLAKQIIDALSEKKVETKPQAPREPVKVTLPSFVKVREFADILKLPVTDVIKALIQNGIMATINEEVDFDTAAIIAQDLGFEVESEASSETTIGAGLLQETLAAENDDDKKPRPPIVAVMGHVDHGKTTLLDAIRKTNIVDRESGGITQHIGAYQVKKNGKTITFLDTPGHEAFVEMRARGANVTDLIVLVVAADDGVRPQTIEVINRAKFTNTPLIVAINKVDKETANTVRVKQELAEYGVLTEDWGGKTVAVEVSAKTNIGIDQLLEMILLTAEVEDFKANPNGATLGTIIESNTSLGKGAVATVIVQNGTLKVGDVIVAGPSFGRIKSLEDEHGRKLKAATPSMPVQISGFSEVPEVGDILKKTETLEEAKSIAFTAQKKQRSHRLQGAHGLQGDTTTKTLNLIIKADVAGSLEAIKQSILKLKNDEVKINILSDAVGEINENDVLLASNSKGTVLAFRVKTNPKAINLAKQKKVAIDSYEVIYELLEDVTSAVIKMFTPELEKVSFGRGKVLAIFRTEKGLMIIGGRVNEGELRKEKPVAIWRNDEEIGRGEILDLQQNKVVVKSVTANNEFGMKVKTGVKLQEGDILESFEENLKQKTLG
jgi:translation initiation factor IF-2